MQEEKIWEMNKKEQEKILDQIASDRTFFFDDFELEELLERRENE